MSESFGSPSQEGRALDVSVKIYPVRDGRNLLANASVTIGGCFAVRGVRVMNSEKGAFVSMPQRKTAEGEYVDICFPTTAEMRATMKRAVMSEYHRTMEQSYSTVDNRRPAPEPTRQAAAVAKSPAAARAAAEPRKSVLDSIQQASAEAKPPGPAKKKTADKAAR